MVPAFSVNSFLLIRWILLLVFGFVLQACSESQIPLKIRIGQVMPPLEAQDLFNQPAIIKPVPGKLLMLNIWATWCGPCRHEMPSMQRFAARLGNDRLELVGLSVDMDEHVVREYLIENKISFPSYLDRDLSEVTGVLGVRMFPSTFFVTPDGVLVKVVEGWREWDSPKLVAEVQALLPPVSSKELSPQINPEL